MGFRSVDSGVERLVAWAEKTLTSPLMEDEPCRVYTSRSYESCLLFGKSPCVRATIKNFKTGKTYRETYFSLYPLVPPIFKSYADARNLDILERVNSSLQKKEFSFESSLDMK